MTTHINIPNAEIFDWLDGQPAEIRALVHDFGINRVRACFAAGVTKPGAVRALLCVLLSGRPDIHNGRQRGLAGVIEGVLVNAGAAVSAAEIVAVIRHSGATIIPTDPTDVGLDASLRALDSVGFVSREAKHRIRLRAALRATDRALWAAESVDV